MNQDEILSRPTRAISAAQREAYFRDGFVALLGFLDAAWLARLRETTADFVEESRTCTASNEKFDLEPDHSAAAPRLRRLSFPVDHHATYRQLAFDSPIADVVEDLLGPDFCYHHSKLNFKWSGGGEQVHWHQDIQFWPHTDYSPLTLGIYLEDVDDSMGPMGLVPGSHRGPLYDLCDASGRWTGHIAAADLTGIDTQRAVYPTGPAGTITVHNCCVVHGSAPNLSTRVRPLLLQTYYAADAFPLMGVGTNGLGRYANRLVRGTRPRHFSVGGRRQPVAPDWSGGYTSIFAVQGEKTD